MPSYHNAILNYEYTIMIMIDKLMIMTYVMILTFILIYHHNRIHNYSHIIMNDYEIAKLILYQLYIII